MKHGGHVKITDLPKKMDVGNVEGQANYRGKEFWSGRRNEGRDTTQR